MAAYPRSGWNGRGRHPFGYRRASKDVDRANMGGVGSDIGATSDNESVIGDDPALVLSPELAVTIVELAPDAILLTDRSGTISFANRQVEAVFGYAPDSLIGRPRGGSGPRTLPRTTCRAPWRVRRYTRIEGNGGRPGTLGAAPGRD